MFVRYRDQNEVSYGWLKDDVINQINGDIFQEFGYSSRQVPLDQVSLLAPVEPSKIVCVGLNYVDHAKEVNLEIPKEPLIFLKPSTTVIGPDDYIFYPVYSKRIEYEGELGIVIKKRAYRLKKEEEAKSYILGYTCANDVTARDLQFGDGQWTRGKSFDTFCPLGPGVVTDINPDDLEITVTLNRRVKQHSRTKNFIFNVSYIVYYISQIMTLLPGDVIITGTPAGVGPMQVGDEVCVTIEGIGQLKNRIKQG
jgi:2-keto-4-pentenoate hydratase/2-oxohepta-3-ene-1,7-dioic acid hydratase in catechol pathway